MKTQTFAEYYLADITSTLRGLIENGEIKEIVSFTLSSVQMTNEKNRIKHFAILIYK